ncbi:DNA repair helicase XPB [Alteribacter natronophilus]|uniref:DNA repair helicase XPB n=1 Tax=Alteribacter natronophilus TaxID=2583810 RepID=UPI00110DB620|nr:DNA repair helicase XPB [Alteribacter natronophilus]TMW73099.1 helicase [Alteribacter natronophilus]
MKAKVKYMREEQPILISSDRKIYLRVDHEQYPIVQPVLQDIAELVKSPQAVHVYEMSSHSIWYACERGMTYDDIQNFFCDYGKTPPPEELLQWMKKHFARYGLLIITRNQDGMRLCSKEKGLLKTLFNGRREVISPSHKEEYTIITEEERGTVKRQLMNLGYPVMDQGGYEEGEKVPFSLREHIQLRPYQKEAVRSVFKSTSLDEGNGIIVLPCGSGKTITGIGLMAVLQQETLIVTPNETSLRQWVRELTACTTLGRDCIGIYTGKEKSLAPITVTTYQMLTRKNREGQFSHLPVFQSRKWGLIIYDEVHLIPAPLFRFAADLQSTRRTGLTATCVREDGKINDIFSLIGPKRYELGIRSLEENGWLSKPVCREIRVGFSDKDAVTYWGLGKREKYRFASENQRKLDVLEKLLNRHRHEKVLIIGHYLSQLSAVHNRFGTPLVTGATSIEERERLYSAFRDSELNCLAVSKVANMALDLPDAAIGIQLSGSYGSRQEEAQRIGRLLRPSQEGKEVTFYSIITAGTQEEERAGNRQLFMLDQGYSYEKEEWSS